MGIESRGGFRSRHPEFKPEYGEAGDIEFPRSAGQYCAVDLSMAVDGHELGEREKQTLGGLLGRGAYSQIKQGERVPLPCTIPGCEVSGTIGLEDKLIVVRPIEENDTSFDGCIQPDF